MTKVTLDVDLVESGRKAGLTLQYLSKVERLIVQILAHYTWGKKGKKSNQSRSPSPTWGGTEVIPFVICHLHLKKAKIVDIECRSVVHMS